MDFKYEFNILAKDEYDKWDEFVKDSPQGTVFHESWWLEQNKNHRIFGCYDNEGQIIAGFVCYEKKLYGLIKSLGSYEVGVYQGVLYSPTSGKYITILSRNRQMSYAMANTIKENCMTAHLSMSPYEMKDIMSFIWEGFTTKVNYTYIINLEDIENVWNEMDPDCRNSIRKAVKDGIYVDSSDKLDQTLKLAQMTFQRQDQELDANSWIRKSPIYHKVAKLHSRCRSFTAKSKSGEPIASVYIIWDNKRSYYVMGGYNHKNAHHGASSLAIWNAIEYTKNSLGLNEFDFEGTSLSTIEPFFRQFGARLVPYYAVSWLDHRIKPFFTLKRLLRETYVAVTKKIRKLNE